MGEPGKGADLKRVADFPDLRTFLSLSLSLTAFFLHRPTSQPYRLSLEASPRKVRNDDFLPSLSSKETNDFENDVRRPLSPFFLSLLPLSSLPPTTTHPPTPQLTYPSHPFS